MGRSLLFGGEGGLTKRHWETGYLLIQNGDDIVAIVEIVL
jgi:hypothetical protein